MKNRPAKRARASIKTVAQRAGVSVTAVSQTLRGIALALVSVLTLLPVVATSAVADAACDATIDAVAASIACGLYFSHALQALEYQLYEWSKRIAPSQKTPPNVVIIAVTAISILSTAGIASSKGRAERRSCRCARSR